MTILQARTLANTQILGFTGSGDGTSNKHINYEGKHINIAVPSYSDENDADPTLHHHNRFVGINSSGDQSGEAGAQEWKKHINDFLKIYLNSPFAKRSGTFSRLVEILAKFLGMNTDHCTKGEKNCMSYW